MSSFFLKSVKIYLMFGMCFFVGMFASGACTIGNSQSCVESNAKQVCPKFQTCVRGWCVPRFFLEGVLTDGVRRDGGGIDRISITPDSSSNRDRSGNVEGRVEGRVEQAPDNKLAKEVVVPEVGVERKVVPDNGCTAVCVLGEVKTCYPSGVKGCVGASCVGACKEGQQFCHKVGSCPGWSVCYGAVVPEAEQCKGEDNDCDGRVDEGCVVTLAGTGVAGFKDGAGKQAQFNGPWGLVFDAKGNLYVSEVEGHRIRKIDISGNVTTYAGTGVAGFKDGKASQAQFNKPWGLVFDTKGNLFVADSFNHRIRKIDSSGNVTTYAGTGVAGFKDGAGNLAKFHEPTEIALDGNGSLFVADTLNGRVRKINSIGEVTTFAGSSVPGFKDGPALSASFNAMNGLVFDGKGNLFIADTGNYRIRKVDHVGNVTTFAGTGVQGNKNGSALDAQFGVLAGLVFDSKNNLYISDFEPHVLRKIDVVGMVTTIGGGKGGFKDGLLKDSLFNYPAGLVFDGKGSLYIADAGNHRIRRWLVP